MKNNIIITLGIILSLVFIVLACDKNNPGEVVVHKESLDIFPQSDAELVFENKAEFLKAVDAVRKGKNDNLIFTRASGGGQFISLFDEFYHAMAEADDFYQKEGGYEAFKMKFPNLYYPEYGEDYSAYLPVSDEAIAKLINQEGKVIISGKEEDLRDVWSYETVQNLGLGMPEDGVDSSPATRALSDHVTLTLDKQDVNDKRKAWITLRGITAETDLGTGKFGRVDLCFRKKGFLGWYNGQMTSNSYIIIRSLSFEGTNNYEERKVYYEGGPKVNEYSPHKYVVASRPASATSSNFGAHRIYFECDPSDTTYSFTGSYYTNIDALLDMNNGTGFGEELASFLTGNTITFKLGYSF